MSKQHRSSLHGPCLLVSLLVLTVVACLPAFAETWRVEKDGSGDFTVIQDALDNAAVGDTIQIGPGRFDDFRIHTFNLGGTGAVLMVPYADDIVIIGTGADLTFVGPEIYTKTYMNYTTGGFVHDVSPPHVEISGITFENVFWPMTVRGRIDVTDCRFDGKQAFSNVYLDGGVGVSLTRCEFLGVPFDDPPVAIGMPINTVNDSLRVVDCSFKWGAGILADGVQGLYVEGCTFENVRTAFSIKLSSGVVTNCRVIAPIAGSVGIGLNKATIELSKTWFEAGAGRTVTLSGESVLSADHCRLGAGSVATVRVGGVATINECDIEKGGTWSVKVDTERSVVPILDFTNCYWGSTDSTQIAEWIDDGNDSSTVPWERAIVDFTPFRVGSVPSRKRSLASLKASF